MILQAHQGSSAFQKPACASGRDPFERGKLFRPANCARNSADDTSALAAGKLGS